MRSIPHWMTSFQFLDAVALGQVTPGPVVATVAAVGYAAHGVGGGAGPAAIGAIFGAAIPLTAALRETWEFVVLGVAAVALLLARRSIVSTLVGARRWSAWCWRWPARRCRGKEVE